MTAAEFEELRAFRADIRALRGELTSLATSLAGCQAASRVRQDLVSRRPSVASAVAAWASLALAVTLAAANLFR